MMKGIRILIGIICFGLFANNAKAQGEEAQQLLLNVEKLAQFKQILSDMKKGYEILNGGYTTIKNLSEGNFNLHKGFMDGLMAVSPTVKNYKKVADIIRFQKILLRDYKTALNQFKGNELINANELSYISGVYNQLIKKSLDNLEDLTMVVTANKLRMSDDERLQAIDRIYDDMQDKVVFLRNFNNETSIMALQRAKEKKDAGTMKSIYGLKQ